MSHVALIFGGPTAEHDVSLVSAKNIFQVLDQTQLRVSLLGITKNRVWKMVRGNELLETDFVNPIDLEKIGIPVQLTQTEEGVFITTEDSNTEKVGPLDVAFPIIHGTFGEDGQLQAELNAIGLEFVGSDLMSSENTFDKAKTKKIASENDIPQAKFKVFEEENPNFNALKSDLGLPFFVKPANMGSSIGISKVKTEKDLFAALAEARIHDKKIVVEEGVIGQEIECALLQDGEIKVSGLGEVIPHHEFYSYEAKYLDPNGAELVIPAKVPADTIPRIQDMAKKAFEVLECRDYARADFFLTDKGEIFFNEINTVPGFTSISQFPMLWKQEGIGYKDLILKLIQNAMKRKEVRTS